MANRIFQLEPDFETGNRPFVVVPENELHNEYSLDGYYNKNPKYDPEDQDTHEYVPFDPSETTANYDSCTVYEEIDGQFSEKKDFEFDEPIGLYETEWDGNNWRNTYYLADYLDTSEVTQEYGAIFDQMEEVFYREHKDGNSTYYAHNERYFVKEVSYWQGSGREVYNELTEDEILRTTLAHGMTKEHYHHFPTIAEMEQAVPVVYYEEGREYGLTFIDLEQCEVGRTTYKMGDGHIDHYRAPDGREFNEDVSYWQGSVTSWNFV